MLRIATLGPAGTNHEMVADRDLFIDDSRSGFNRNIWSIYI